MSRISWANLSGLAVVVAVVLVWQALGSADLLDAATAPSPVAVGGELWDLSGSGELTQALFHTIWVVLVGSGGALVLGVIFGSALGLSPIAYQWSMASVDFLRTIPVVALLPVAVVLWGPSIKAELIITIFAATWVMTVNTAGAFQMVHARLLDVGRTFRLSRAERLRKIWLPAIVPTLLVGGRLTVITAALTAIIAEALVNPAGLGWELIRAQQSLRPELLWAIALVAGAFGYLLNLALIQGVRLLSPGGRANPALGGVE